MESLKRQNELQRGYIITLQKQNQAKNAQRTALLHEIDRLTSELDTMSRQLSSAPSTVSSNNNNSRLQKELKSQKNSNKALGEQIISLKNKISEYNNAFAKKQEEVQRLSKEIQSYLLELQSLRDSQRQYSSAHSQIVMLQSEMATYKSKITQTTSLEQHLRASNNRIAELQNLQITLQSDFRKIQAENKRMEVECREMRVNNKSAAQISGLLSSKLNLQATMRQLNGKIEWLQGNSKAMEQQRVQLQTRSREMQKELLQTKGRIMQLKMNQQSYNSAEVNIMIKEKEMEALEQMILSLKQNKKYLERTLKDKDELILSLQSQLHSAKALKNDNEQAQRQINDLKSQRTELQKQLSALLKNNQSLESEVSKFNIRQQSLIEQISLTKQERDRLLREREEQSATYEQTKKQLKVLQSKINKNHHLQQTPIYNTSVPEKDTSHDYELRTEVEKLRSELDQLKYLPQFKPQNNQNHSIMQPVHSQSKDYLEVQHFNQKREVSPDWRVHPKLHPNNDKVKPPGNRQKWQSLQKKINALRNENQTLKKSLFN